MKSMLAGLLLLLGGASHAHAAFFDDHKVMFFFASTGCTACNSAMAPVPKNMGAQTLRLSSPWLEAKALET